MGTNKNILMRNFNGTDWDNLYPQTLSTNVYDSTTGIDVGTDIHQIKTPAYYGEITYKTYYDSVSGTYYSKTFIPYKDQFGNVIKLKHGFQNDAMNSGVGETARSFCNRHNASLVFNASRWNTSTGQIYGIQIKDGQILQDIPHGNNYTLGIKADGTLKAYPPSWNASQIIADGCTDTVSGFYPFIMNGEPVDPAIYQSDGDPNNPNPRQAIGQLSTKDIVILTAEGRTGRSKGMTYADMTRIMMSWGVQFAYNLDGGGSSQTVVRGVLTTTPIDDDGMTERLVSDFLYVETPDSALNKLSTVNVDLGFLAKKITELQSQIDYLTNFYQGYIKIDGEPGYNAEGIVMSEGGENLTKLYLREGDISYWHYGLQQYIFRAHKTGELQTVKGQIADVFSVLSTVSNLNTVDNTGFVWANGQTTANVPDTGTSWGVIHFKYDSDNKMQIAFPFSTNTAYTAKTRRTSNGEWQAWRDL